MKWSINLLWIVFFSAMWPSFAWNEIHARLDIVIHLNTTYRRTNHRNVSDSRRQQWDREWARFFFFYFFVVVLFEGELMPKQERKKYQGNAINFFQFHMLQVLSIAWLRYFQFPIVIMVGRREVLGTSIEQVWEHSFKGRALSGNNYTNPWCRKNSY